MPPLQDRLPSVLGDVLSVEEEPDGALTVRHNGTFASLRVVNIAPDLDLVSLTQVLAWELPLTRKSSELIAKQARDVNFGSLTVVEKVPEKIPEKAVRRNSGRSASKVADVLLRYNFPGGGLTDDALRTLILLVLDTGVQIRDALTG